MSETDPKKLQFVIARLSQHDIESYFSVKYCDTKKLVKLRKIMKGLKPADFGKLARSMGDEYRTDYFWQSLEYNFEKLFIHNGIL